VTATRAGFGKIKLHGQKHDAVLEAMPNHYRIEDFMQTTAVLGAAFSSDETSILFSSDASGVFNAYEVPVCGGKPRQLTHSASEATYGLAYLPDNRLLLSRDCGGNENFHLYVVNVNGEEHDLTPGDDVTMNFLGENRDRGSLYCTTNERDPRFFDIYRIDAADLTRCRLFDNTDGYQFGCISKDERLIALTKIHTRENADIYLYDTTTHQIRLLTPHEGDICFRASCFDVNTNYLYYRTDKDSEFFYVARYDLQSGETETVVKQQGNTSQILSPHGRYQAVALDLRGRITMCLLDQASGRAVPMPDISEGEIKGLRFSESERLMAFYVDGDRAPDNLYVFELDTGDIRRLTNSLNPAIGRHDLVDSQSVSYRSFDGLEIPALLWKPRQATAMNRVPALVWVHGGPGGQTRKGYSAKIQFLVNHGYAVLGVNYRGSSGYGKAFLAADNRKHGREPLWDCIEAKKYLGSLDYVDASRIGIIGASYGGYMVLAALAFHPREFAVGVDLFGNSNWLTTLASFPPYWSKSLGDYHKKVGDPKTDAEMLREISPLFKADRIVKPLLVLQGANDPRVLRAESDAIVDVVKKNSGIVEYVVFPDEGHGFTKRANKIAAYGRILEFLDRYLKQKAKRSVVGV